MTEPDWNSCTDPQKMLNWLREQGRVPDRNARLFAVACCCHIWPLLTDQRSQRAIEVLERYTEGRATAEELSAAARAAQEVADNQQSTDNPYAAAAAANAVGSDLPPRSRGRGDEDEDGQARCDPISSAKDAAFAAAWAAGHAAHPEDSGDEWYAATKSGEAMHCHLLRCILGNPFRPVRLDPTWLTWNDGTILRMATAIYEERSLSAGILDTVRLAVLADALEDAGCTDAGLVGHLRGPGPHVRGCFVLDLLLGKE